MKNINIYNEMLAAKVIKGLKQRNMNGYYFKTPNEAVDFINDMIKPQESVAFGGSMTLTETGMLDMLRQRSDITLHDRDKCTTPDELGDCFRQAFFADSFLMSTNAITEDGQLVNIDGNGNRVSALIFGPKKVIIIAGLNKISPTVDAAMLRARSYASPINNIRLNKNNPCTKTGDCHNCFSDESICNQFVITRRSGAPDRINVVLIDGNFGY